jgi:hypothetical protein
METKKHYSAPAIEVVDVSLTCQLLVAVSQVENCSWGGSSVNGQVEDCSWGGSSVNGQVEDCSWGGSSVDSQVEDCTWGSN